MTNTKPSQAKAQPCQKLPAGQFDSSGMSNGKQTGAVRKTADAVQGPRNGQSK